LPPLFLSSLLFPQLTHLRDTQEDRGKQKGGRERGRGVKMKKNLSAEYDTLPCPACKAKPGCLELNETMSMIVCSQCGAVVQENIVASGDANLQWDTYKHGWRPHGVVVKSSQSGADVARAMLYLDKQQRSPFTNFNFVSGSESRKGGQEPFSSEGTDICRVPLANLASKLKLPENARYEAECLFNDVFSKTEIHEDFATPSGSGLDGNPPGSSKELAVVASPDGKGEESSRSAGGASTSTALVPCSPPPPPPVESDDPPPNISTQEVEILVGACVYAACRMQHIPLLLEDIAGAINCDKNVLYHMSKEMRDTMGLELPVLDLQQLLKASLASLQQEYSREVLDVSALLVPCTSLLKFCNSQYISDGKHPMGLMAAIIHVVTKNVFLCPTTESCTSVVGRVFSVEEIAQALRCKASTTNSRIAEIYAKFKELKERFLGSAAVEFPCLPCKEGWNNFDWDKASQVPDRFVMQWISNLQAEGESQRQRMIENGGTGGGARESSGHQQQQSIVSVSAGALNEQDDNERFRKINTLLVASVASSASGKKRKANSKVVERAKQQSKVLKHVSRRSAQWQNCFASLGKRSVKQQQQQQQQQSQKRGSVSGRSSRRKGKQQSGSSPGKEIVTVAKEPVFFQEMGNAVSNYFFPATRQKLILGYTFNDKKPMTPEDLDSTFKDIQQTRRMSQEYGSR